jgi:hypothetical protein
MARFSKTQLLPTLHVCPCRLCPMSSWTYLSTVVFGQSVHSILILLIFLLGLFAGQSLTASNGKSKPLPSVRRMSTCRRQRFQHLIWSVNCNYFISKVIGQQAYWFIGKIRMRLAACRVPINKCKNLSVHSSRRTLLHPFFVTQNYPLLFFLDSRTLSPTEAGTRGVLHVYIKHEWQCFQRRP